jgi:hypothetical protein
LGEVLTHEGNNREPFADFYELDRWTRDLRRFPPADVRVEGPSEVVLVDLVLVE